MKLRIMKNHKFLKRMEAVKVKIIMKKKIEILNKHKKIKMNLMIHNYLYIFKKIKQNVL